MPDYSAGSIGYRLDIPGVRVWKDHGQPKDVQGRWAPPGATRPLPVNAPMDPAELGSDSLVLTAYQYDMERPGSDLRAVLARRVGLEESPATEDRRDEMRAATGGMDAGRR